MKKEMFVGMVVVAGGQGIVRDGQSLLQVERSEPFHSEGTAPKHHVGGASGGHPNNMINDKGNERKVRKLPPIATNLPEAGNALIGQETKDGDKAEGCGLVRDETGQIKHNAEDDNKDGNRMFYDDENKNDDTDDVIGGDNKDDSDDYKMSPRFAQDHSDVDERNHQHESDDVTVQPHPKTDAEPVVDSIDSARNALITNSIDQNPATDEHVTESPPSRRFSVFEDFAVPEVIYKFTSPRWLVGAGLFSFMFSGLGFYTAFCQLLGQESIDPAIFYADFEQAKRLIENPNYTTQCIDSFQSGCTEQYAYSSFFFLYGVYLAYLGLVRMFANCSFFKESSLVLGYRLSVREKAAVHPEETLQPDDGRALQSMISKASDVYSIYEKSWIGRRIREIKLGGHLFWIKSFVILLVDITLQCLRCFIVSGSYATTNATHTLVQVVLMVLNINFCMSAFYIRSEVGFASLNWIFEMSYLALRLSINGNLSMRASGFIDFLTLAIPFIFAIEEIRQVTNYILSARRAREDEQQVVGVVQQHRGKIVSMVMLLATIFGAVVSYKVVQTGFFGNDCDDIIHLFPHMDCRQWQYNLFLEPSCSCSYLEIYASPGAYPKCSIFSHDPERALFEPVLDHFTEIFFLDIGLHTDCPLDDQDFDLMTSFTSLRSLDLSGLDVANLGSEFKRLPNLVSVDIKHSSLQQVDLDVLNGWPLLERFSCNPCPYFRSQDLLPQADLPQLQHLELYGVSSCSESSGLANIEFYRCVDRNATEVCPTMPQWYVQHWVDRAKSASRTDCYQPRCDRLLSYFEQYMGDDGLMSEQEFRFDVNRVTGPLEGEYASYSIDGIHCLMKEIRAAVPFEQDFYEGAVIEDGLTVLEHAAMWTAYGNCAQCEQAKQIISTGAEEFSERNQNNVEEVSLPPACASLWDGPAPFNVWEINEVCHTETTACIPEICFGPTVDVFDIDSDKLMTEEEFQTITTVHGVSGLAPPGFFDCVDAATQPGCVSKTATGNLAIDLGRVMGIIAWIGIRGTSFDNIGSTCSDCELNNFPHDDPDCQDNEEFVDVFGYPCIGWQGAYCYDEIYAAYLWGYSVPDMEAVKENCAATCTLCQ